MNSSVAVEGTWQMIRGELSGDPAPELVTTKTQVEFAAGSYRVRFAGEIADRGRYELGGTLEARTMVLHGETGPNAGRTIPCIYQLTGNLLRICYGFDSVTPTEFATTAGDQRYLAFYRRHLAPGEETSGTVA